MAYTDQPPPRKAGHLGGDFTEDDASWPALVAHLLEVVAWLETLRARRAHAEAADGDGVGNAPTAPGIGDPVPAELW
jgi:hypothetical protein